MWNLGDVVGLKDGSAEGLVTATEREAFRWRQRTGRGYVEVYWSHGRYGLLTEAELADLAYRVDATAVVLETR